VAWGKPARGSRPSIEQLAVASPLPGGGGESDAA
jgi:hypothetical protein